ncbi:MAG: hypothetical protein Q7R41_03680, partial [Phycisphaerales bacterium]|nr:hypothetical protein [Phycisphaerales bacterium]
VLNNDGKQLTLQWRKEIEATIIRKVKVTRPGPNPLSDLDGDGRIEITLNLFNDTGDRKWHATSYDALTGDTRFDLPDTYLHGMADVNSDGLPELFVGEARRLAVPRFGSIRLLSLKGGRQTAFWSHGRGCWQTTLLTHMPYTAETGAADGTRTVLLGRRANGEECYVVADEPSPQGSRQSLVIVAKNASGKWQSVSGLSAPAGVDLQVKAVRGAKNDLLVGVQSADRNMQRIQCDRAKAEVVSRRTVPGPTPVPIAARLRPREIPTVIFQNGSEQIVAMQKVRGVWKTRWRQAGRGMTNSSPAFAGVLSADVNGDGAMETLFARVAKSGEAELVAVDPDGKQVWSHVFTGFDGAAPIWNFGGLTYWTVGHFTSKSHYDVFASLRRSTMHSDESYCLSGKDGRVLWHQDCVKLPGETDHESERGYAGVLLAAADVDGDRFDELICEFPDRYWVASGKTGAIRTVVNTANGIFPNMWVAYAVPIVGDFRAEGKPQVLWGSCHYVTALLDIRGKPLWFGKYNDGSTVAQGVGNTEGPGRIFIGGDGYSDG